MRTTFTSRPHEFAHNRSFELRLKNTAEVMLQKEKQQQQQQQQQSKQREGNQRRWVAKKMESRTKVSSSEKQSTTSSSSGVSRQDNISKLAESNRLAVFRSEPAPLVSSQYVCNDCNVSDTMNSSTFRYFENILS